MLNESSRLDALLGQNRILSESEKGEALLKCAPAVFVWPGIGKTKEDLLSDSQSGLIIGTTTALDSMFGYEEGELLGQPLEILMPQRFRNHHKLHFVGFVLNPIKRLMGKSDMELFGITKPGVEFQMEIALEQKLVNRQKTIIALVQYARKKT